MAMFIENFFHSCSLLVGYPGYDLLQEYHPDLKRYIHHHKITLLEPNSFFWSADCGSQEVQPEHCNIFGTKHTISPRSPHKTEI